MNRGIRCTRQPHPDLRGRVRQGRRREVHGDREPGGGAGRGQGTRVGVLDADVWGYSQPTLFGVRERPVAVQGIMLPVDAQGVALMSVGFFVADDEPVVWRGPMLHKALEQFLEDVYWGAPRCAAGRSAARHRTTSPSPCSSCCRTRRWWWSPPRSMPRSRWPPGSVGWRATRGCPSPGSSRTCRAAPSAPGEGTGWPRTWPRRCSARCPWTQLSATAGDAGVPLVLGTPEHPSSQLFRRMAESLPRVRRSIVGRSLPLFVDAPRGGRHRRGDR